MEPGELDYLKKIIEDLLEEKNQIKNQSEKLNRLYANRERALDEFKNLYLEAKHANELKTQKIELEKTLEADYNFKYPKNPDENSLKAFETNKNTQIKTNSLENPELNQKNLKENIKLYKSHIKDFKKSLASLVRDIKSELDIFQVCLSADLEAFYIIKHQQEPEKKVLKSKTFISEVISSENDEKTTNSTTFSQATPENSGFEDFSIIKFSGISKKPKKSNQNKHKSELDLKNTN
jgi:hypothetical protein